MMRRKRPEKETVSMERRKPNLCLLAEPPGVGESDKQLPVTLSSTPEVKDQASLTTFMSSLSQVLPRRHWFISDR
ncbi:unnamed protein product [Brassica rapa subsp. narinosa]